MFGSSVPEIDVQELARKLASSESFVVLDVRELWAFDQAKITDSRLEVAPMSRLSSEGMDALPESAQVKDALLCVMCHHGVRSADVTAWLVAQGWTNVFSVRGGIDEYARRIDRSVGMY